MIYEFICPTETCENHTNPVYLIDPTNPVLCSLCGAYGDAFLVDPQPSDDTE